MRFSEFEKKRRRPAAAEESRKPAEPAKPPSEPPPPSPPIRRLRPLPPLPARLRLPLSRPAPAPAPRAPDRTKPEPRAPAGEAGRPEPPARRGGPSARRPRVTAAQAAESDRQARAAYGQAIAAVREVFKDPEPAQGTRRARLEEAVEALSREIQRSAPALLALTMRSTASDYLYGHSVNVAILSMHLGAALGWAEGELRLLGLAGLLNDIGMTRHKGLAAAPRTLTPEEFREVSLHPLEGRRLLEHIGDVEEAAKGAISEIMALAELSKDRPVAGAEPRGAHMAALIISLCDIYEAMTHPRSWRQPLLPSAAMETLLRRHSRDYPRALWRVFLERLTFYPPGSYVELSGGEIGRVLDVHGQTPTRPIVEIRFRADLSAQEPPVIIDLLDKPLLNVSKPVDETQLKVKDGKLALALQADRWWLD